MSGARAPPRLLGIYTPLPAFSGTGVICCCPVLGKHTLTHQRAHMLFPSTRWFLLRWLGVVLCGYAI